MATILAKDLPKKQKEKLHAPSITWLDWVWTPSWSLMHKRKGPYPQAPTRVSLKCIGHSLIIASLLQTMVNASLILLVGLDQTFSLHSVKSLELPSKDQILNNRLRQLNWTNISLSNNWRLSRKVQSIQRFIYVQANLANSKWLNFTRQVTHQF